MPKRMSLPLKSPDEEIAGYLPRLNVRQKRTFQSVVKAFMEEQKDCLPFQPREKSD